MTDNTVQENLWDLVVKFFFLLIAILIVMFIKTAYNVYHIPGQLRKVQESLEKAIAKHQERLNEMQDDEGQPPVCTNNGADCRNMTEPENQSSENAESDKLKEL